LKESLDNDGQQLYFLNLYAPTNCAYSYKILKHRRYNGETYPEIMEIPSARTTNNSNRCHKTQQG